MEWLAYALGIGFWVLCALAVVCLMVLTFIKLADHRKNDLASIAENIAQTGLKIADDVAEKIDIGENNS